MERPSWAQGGENDLLLWCVHYIEQKDCKSGSSCHTGGSVQGRAVLLYFMARKQLKDTVAEYLRELAGVVTKKNLELKYGVHIC